MLSKKRKLNDGDFANVRNGSLQRLFVGKHGKIIYFYTRQICDANLKLDIGIVKYDRDLIVDV